MADHDVFGLKIGTNVSTAAKLAARPNGTTMGEIIDATGDTQYNIFKRLEAKGYAVRREGSGRSMRIWLNCPADESGKTAPENSKDDLIQDGFSRLIPNPSGNLEHSLQEIREYPKEGPVAVNSPREVKNDDLTVGAKMLPVSKIKIPAARVRQGALVLYATALKVRQLVSQDFYNIRTEQTKDRDCSKNP